MTKFIATFILLLTATPAYAYIGPGMGAGAIASVIGVIVSIFVALVALLYYPIKRFLRKNKANAENDQ